MIVICLAPFQVDYDKLRGVRKQKQVRDHLATSAKPSRPKPSRPPILDETGTRQPTPWHPGRPMTAMILRLSKITTPTARTLCWSRQRISCDSPQ
jgi:hypothetical protein